MGLLSAFKKTKRTYIIPAELRRRLNRLFDDTIQYTSDSEQQGLKEKHDVHIGKPAAAKRPGIKYNFSSPHYEGGSEPQHSVSAGDGAKKPAENRIYECQKDDPFFDDTFTSRELINRFKEKDESLLPLIRNRLIDPAAVLDLSINRLYAGIFYSLAPISCLVPALHQLLVILFQNNSGDLTGQLTDIGKDFLLQFLEGYESFLYNRFHHTDLLMCCLRKPTS